MLRLNVYFLLATFLISGCSPFGNQSLIQDISNSIGILIPEKTSTTLVSSASETTTTPSGGNTGIGLQPYKVTHTVGDAYQQPTTRARDVHNLPSGYTVYSSAQSNVK